MEENMKYKNKDTLPSARFGGWKKLSNGFSQLNLTPKEFIKNCTTGNYTPNNEMTRKQAKAMLKHKKTVGCWYSDNGKYKVVVDTINYGDGMCHDNNFSNTVWLSIRIDNGDTHLCDWRDFQSIKNDFCGEEYCAIEIYPPESRLVDMANVFHLWVFPEGIDIPIGWSDRDVSYHEEPNQRQKEVSNG